METYDPQMAQRVWQRVYNQPQTQPDGEELLSLIAQEWTDATTYLHLSRRYQGKAGTILHRMFQDEQAHAACLKGIYTLMTGKHPTVRSVPPSQEPVPVILRRCYGREMHSLAQYEARAADPEYGQVFSRLAEQEREHCRRVLELLGNLKQRM